MGSQLMAMYEKRKLCEWHHNATHKMLCITKCYGNAWQKKRHGLLMLQVKLPLTGHHVPTVFRSDVDVIGERNH